MRTTKGPSNLMFSGFPGPNLNSDILIDYIVDTRGGDRSMWQNVADMIAYHETGPQQRMDPRARQITEGGGQGPGRGLFQFEDSTASGSFDTAKQRYKNTIDAVRDRGYVLELDPEIMAASNADELTADQQRAIFYANLIQGPASLRDYAEGNMSLEDLWLKGHKLVEKEGNRGSFRESVSDAQEREEPIEAVTREKGGRVVKYQHGGKHDDDPPENFGVADNLLQVLGTYGKTREEAEQDPNYEDRLDLTKEEVFDNFMDRYGPNLTSELRKPQNPNSPFYDPDRNPRRGGLEDLEEQMDKVRVIKEDPIGPGTGAYFNTQTDEVYFSPEVSRSSVDRGSVSGEEFTHSIQDPFREGRGKYGSHSRRPFDAAIQGLLDSSREDEVDYRTGKKFKLLPETGVLAPDLGLDDSQYSDLAESLYYGGNTQNPVSSRNAEHELEAMMNTGLLQGIKTGVIPEGTITQDDLPGIVDRYNQGVAERPNVQMVNENFQNSPVMTRDLHPKKEKFWQYDESGKPTMTKKGKKYYDKHPYQLRKDLGMEDYVSRETFQTNPRHVRNLVALINKDVAGHDPMGREEMRNLMNYLNQEGYVRPDVEYGDNYIETGNKRYVNDRRNARRAGYAPRGGRDNPYLND